MNTSALLITLFVLGAEPTEARVISELTLTDGQQLRGYIVEETEERYVVELASGGRMEVAASSVESVRVNERITADAKTGELREGDPNRTRYFYSPSAHMLKKGEGYFSQKELLFSSVAYGVTDNISVLAGAVLPFWFIGNGAGFNFIFGAKAGGEVAPGIHLAAGAETLMLPGFGYSGPSAMFAGFLFGTATIGSEEQHLSVSVGRPFFFSQYGSGAPAELIATLSGSIRVHKHLALVTENWLIPSSTMTVGFFSGGLRLMAGRIAVDLGAILPATSTYGVSPIPLPWLDFTYNFG